jgi:hypothetical protein
MVQAILVAILAGFASAVLSGVLTPGSLSFALLVFLAPLPLMIAGLGWHPYVAALGGVLATLAINISFGTRPSLAFIGTVAGPSFALCWYAERLFSRSAREGGYPGIDLGRLAIAATLGIAIIVVATTLWIEPDFEEFLKRLRVMVEQVVGAMGRAPNAPPIPPNQLATITDLMTRLMLPLSGFLVITTLALSGIFAIAIVQLAKRLHFPRPDFRLFRMPGGSLMLFGLALAATLLGGYTGIFAEIVLLGLALMYMFQGLAVLHWKTIGNPIRTMILTGAWFVILTIGLPALVFVAIGMADHLLDFRRPKPGQT